jgi:hypothetical protein
MKLGVLVPDGDIFPLSGAGNSGNIFQSAVQNIVIERSPGALRR